VRFWRKLLRKTEVTNSKCFASASSELLRLFFTSNSAVFVGGAQNIHFGVTISPKIFILFSEKKEH